MKTIILLLFLMISTASFSQNWMQVDDSGEAHALKNKPAPSFKSVMLDNKEIAIEDFKGKIVLLNFWSLTCAACFKELPELNEMVKKYPKEEFVIVSLMDNSKDELLNRFTLNDGKYAMKKPVFGNDKIEFQIIPDAKSILKLYNGQIGFPQTFILDQAGKTTFYLAGYAEKRGLPYEVTTEQFFTKEIDRLLNVSR